MKILTAILMFFIVAALLIISNNNLVFSNPENIRIFCASYGKWLGSLYDNLAAVTGNAVRMEWLPR